MAATATATNDVSPDAATRDASSDGACTGGADGRPVVRAAGVCIDVYEVTIGAYAEFVKADASPVPDAGRCMGYG